jgi:hypothetical protein
MADDLVASLLDWKQQARDFEHDGSLRDIMITGTTVDDWRRVLDLILQSDMGAEYSRGGEVQSPPRNVESIFRDEIVSSFSFSILGVAVHCYFFTPDEIEFSFQPREITEPSLVKMLQFLVDLGDLTQKTAIISPENCYEAPMFRYAPDAHRLEWIPARYPYADLYQLFGAYFHQNWALTAGTPDDVITLYVSEGRSHVELSRLADLVDELVRSTSDDEVLERTIGGELGCYYLPTADGISMRRWLTHVAERLRMAPT